MKTILYSLAFTFLSLAFFSCENSSSCRLSHFEMKGDYCEVSVENLSDYSTAFDTRCTIDLILDGKYNDRTTVGFGNLRAGEEGDGIGYFITSDYDKAEIVISWADKQGNYQSKSYTRY